MIRTYDVEVEVITRRVVRVTVSGMFQNASDIARQKAARAVKKDGNLGELISVSVRDGDWWNLISEEP